MVRGSVHFQQVAGLWKHPWRFSFFNNFKKLTLTIIHSFKFSLYWSPASLNLEFYCMQPCRKDCRKLEFSVFLEQLFLRGVFKPSQTSNMKVIAEIINASKPFNYFILKFHLRCLTGFWILLWSSAIAV